MSESQQADFVSNPGAPPIARPASGGHPLGPLVQRPYHPRPLQVRLIASVVLIGCIAALMLAAWLKPDVRGVGTHEQLGLPACSLVRFAGIPCPTCGMTTAFAYTIRGHWIAGLLAQPFAFVLALGIFLCIPLSAQALISAKTWRVNWY